MAVIHDTYVDIMMLLYNRGSLPAKDIAKALSLDRSNVYKYLENLTDLEWVTKEQGLFFEGAEVCFKLSKQGRTFLRIYPDADDLPI